MEDIFPMCICVAKYGNPWNALEMAQDAPASRSPSPPKKNPVAQRALVVGTTALVAAAVGFFTSGASLAVLSGLIAATGFLVDHRIQKGG